MTLLLALLPSIAQIQSVNELAAAIEAGPLRTVGFLSQGNYDAVASVLPPLSSDGGTLEVAFYNDLDELEAAVVSGSILAGGSTSRPSNADGHLSEFPSSVVTMRAPMFAPPGGGAQDSQQLREAIDAAIVRAVAAQEYQRLESQYFASNGFESVAAFTCGLNPTNFPFPPAASATGLLAQVLASNELRVGALGPSNWGYQGSYADSNGVVNPNPTGLWPEYMDAILAQFVTAYPGVSMARVWNRTSNGVMDHVVDGRAHMTEPYWTVSGYYRGRARSEHLEVGCTVLGTESIFFTPGAGSSNNDLPTWAIAVIAVGGAMILIAGIFVAVLVTREKAGTPIFNSIKEASSTTGKNAA
jgi:hypothetical protein